jgi:hypothetical protein
MSITCSATKVFDSGALYVNSGALGVVSQRDGSFCFGYQQGFPDFPPIATAHWLRSTDNGFTWAATGDTFGLNGQMGAFPTNIQPNVICSPYWIAANNESGILRSTNHGLTWTSVMLDGPAPSPNGRAVFCYGVQSHDKTHAIAWGALDGNDDNPAKIYATSTDGGLTWTLRDAWDPAGPFDSCNSMGIAAGGLVWAQYMQGHTDPRVAKFARSEDYGLTWTVLSTMGSLASPPLPAAWAIAALDSQNIVMGGNNGAIPPDGAPGLWWSDDAGDTLHLVSPGDINDWPGGSGNNVVQEVKRLTNDACLVCFDNQNGGSPVSCWRISLDKGHTYEIVVDLPGPASAYQVPFGKVCVTHDGALLLPLWESDDYDEIHVNLYRAPITCS